MAVRPGGPGRLRAALLRTAATGSPASPPDGCGWQRGGQQPVHPGHRAAHLAPGEQRVQRRRPSAPSSSARSRDSTSTASSVQRRAAPLPQQGAQLVLGREADAVVDALDPPVGAGQQVAALAVGVVDHGVEDRHPAQVRVVAAGQLGQVDRLVDVDPQLAHARRRTARRACTVGGTTSQPLASLTRYAADLAPGQRPVREVPQRALAAHRLVDAGRGDAVEGRPRSRASRWRRRRAGPRRTARPRRSSCRASSRSSVAEPDLRASVVRPVSRRGPRDRHARTRTPVARAPSRPVSGGGRSAAGRCAPRRPAAARTAGTAAGRRRRRAGRAARTPGPPRR